MRTSTYVYSLARTASPQKASVTVGRQETSKKDRDPQGLAKGDEICTKNPEE